jgi:hypothetical protein
LPVAGFVSDMVAPNFFYRTRSNSQTLIWIS